MESGDGDIDGGDQLEEKQEKTEVVEQQLESQASGKMVVKVVERSNIQHHQVPEWGQGVLTGEVTDKGRLSEADNDGTDGSGDSNVENNVDRVVSKTKDEYAAELERGFVDGGDGAEVGKDDVCGGRDAVGNGSNKESGDKNEFEQYPRPSELTEDEISAAASTTGDVYVELGVSFDACMVITSDIQTELHEADDLEKDVASLRIKEHTHEDCDGGEVVGTSHVSNTDGTVEGDDRAANPAQIVTEFVVDQSQATLLGTGFETIPISDQSGPSAFPALDNVDFETDEEVHEVERDAGKDGHAVCDDGVQDSRDKVEGDIVDNDDDEGEQKVKIAGSEGSITRDHEVMYHTSAYDGIDDSTGEAAVSVADSQKRPNDEFPLNYQNYTVCREVRPGVKECIILETGEQFICVTKPKSPLDGSPDPHQEKVDVQGSVGMTQPEHKRDVQPSSAVANASSETEALSYTLFQKDGAEVPDPRASDALENIQQEQISESRISSCLKKAEVNEKHWPLAENGTRSRVSPCMEESFLYGQYHDEVSQDDIVEDVLSSETEGDMSRQLKRGKESSLKTRREKRERFIELQPVIAAENTEENSRTSWSDANVNNNSNQRDPVGGENTNENAKSRPHLERDQRRSDVTARSSYYPIDRSHSSEQDGYIPSYDHYMTGLKGLGRQGSRTYSQAASRDSSYFDGRGQRSEEDSSFYRSREPSSQDSSQISTRYTRIERGVPRNTTSKSESLTIPKFKTLQDQQVNWLEMFKMIEQQHRTELQSQYLEHQKILQDMQKNMEKELLKQQDTLKQRLLTHREMLEEISPGRNMVKNVNQSWTRNDRDSSSTDSQRSADTAVVKTASHITLQGVPVALRNPPPISRYHHESQGRKTPDDLPVKRSLEKELSSPLRPADTSLNLASHVSIDRDKLLRGGVYSSPLPLAKVKHKKSPSSSKSYDDTQHRSPVPKETSHNTNSVHWGHEPRIGDAHWQESADVSLSESDETLSPRTRISLREKHAKHVADLRTYYDKELLELRRDREMEGGGGQEVTARDQILASENQELRQKCQGLQDAYHDAKIEIRELQQKIQGLEIRASDYAERYSATQSQVLALRSRLEELTDFAREKESIIADLASKNKKDTDSLQIAYKKEKDLTESLHNAKNTIQKLVDKYETLEKEHGISKDTLKETQEKLYSSRAEFVDANNKLSRLELENKQLKHDIENLRRDLTMARSSATMHTSYEDAYHKTGSPDRRQQSYSSIHIARNRSADRSYNSHSGDRQPDRTDISPESESDNDYLRSPIMKAERELKRLHHTQDYTPKLQRKFYGTDRPSSYSGPPITVDRTSGHSGTSPHSTKAHSPRDKKTQLSSQGREINSKPSVPTSSYISRSQRDNSRLSKDNGKSDARQNFRDKDSNRNRSISPKKTSNVTNGLTSDQAIERVKAGEIVSRPAWEDVYTSLASGRPGNSESKSSPMNYTRDDILRERLQNIENLERKYDDLNSEKHRFEAALSKLPGQGHGRERDRIETELDRLDRELGSVRMSLKRYHVLKSTI